MGTLIFSDSQFKICLCITVFVTNVSCENPLDIAKERGKVRNVIPVQGINGSAFLCSFRNIYYTDISTEQMP